MSLSVVKPDSSEVSFGRLLCLCQAKLTDYRGIMFSNWPLGRPFVCASIYLLPKLRIQYFENELTVFDANWHKWSGWQRHETISFGVRRSKVKVTWQSHKNPFRRNISRRDLEAWWRHLSWTLGSSSFCCWGLLPHYTWYLVYCILILVVFA